MNKIPEKRRTGTPTSKAKCQDQSARGNAFVGVAAALQSRKGLQYLVFAADLYTLRAAWAEAGGALFDASMAKTVAVFEHLKTPAVPFERAEWAKDLPAGGE